MFRFELFKKNNYSYKAQQIMLEKIKLIAKSIRQYKKYAIWTPILMVIEALMECAMPFVMSMLIDTITQAVTVTATHPYNELHEFSDIFKTLTYTNVTLDLKLEVTIFGIIITLIVMALISLSAGFIGGRTAARASVGLQTNLREDIYKKIQTFSFANIDKFHSSSLITRLTTDVNQVGMAFQMMIRIVVRAPLMIIFSAVMAFVAGGWMAVIFILLIPAIGLGLWLIGKNAFRIFTKVFKRYDKLNESVQENVSGIRVVKSYVREDYEKKKFSDASNSLAGGFIKAEKLVALSDPLLNTTIHISNILVISIGTYAIYRGTVDNSFWIKLTVGQMSSLITYGIQILVSILMISMIMVMMLMSVECVRRISEVLTEEPSIKNPENPIYEVKNGDIVFDNVNFKYKETAQKCALSNVNLNIKSGEFVGILGSTGSGKTSLVNLISRLYDVTEGHVLVGDHDVREYDIPTLRKSVSVVLQKNVLFSGTIASNLKWGKEDATEEEMNKACAIAQATEIVKAKKDGLNSKVEQGGANFSGGQKQRLCIARAIVGSPKILILDDSTSAVDTKTDKLIRKGLKEDLPNITKIVIAQRISSIEDADKIIVLDDGEISAIGTHKELLKKSKIYKEVYETQNRVGGAN